MFNKQEENQNLLDNIPPPSQQHQSPQQARKGVNLGVDSNKLHIVALYGLLMFLIIALLYHIIFLLFYSTTDITPQNTYSSSFPYPQKQITSAQSESQQKNHRFSEAKLKELKLIELQKQMVRLNRMIQSKSQYNENLIATQLQKQRKVRLKYWDVQSSKERIEVRRKQGNDSSYISNMIVPQQSSNFPKIVWMYIQQNITSQSNLTQLLISNLAEYLQLHGYDFYLIGQYNFRYLMSNRHEEQLGYVLTDLWHLAYETNLTTNLKDHTFTIKKHLISLIMLSQLGGILIDKDLVLTQDLIWLENFKELALANRGRSEQPNIVGFYHVNYTESIDEVQINEFQKKVVHLYPPLDPYFIAVSRKGINFISEVLQRYYVLLQYPEKVKSILKQYQMRLKEISGDDPYYQAIFIASSWVLKRKQIQLDLEWERTGKQSLRPLAIDHYGIYQFNRVYGPLKYRFLFSQVNKSDIYSFISKLNYSDLVSQFGNVSFAIFLPFQDYMDSYITKAQEGEEQFGVVRDSLLGRFVLNELNESWADGKGVVKQVFEVESGVEWNLPKKVWVYLSNKSIVSKLCLHNIFLACNSSKLELIVLNDSNLKNYLKGESLSKLKASFQSRRLQSQNKTLDNVWVQLIKLAIMYQHGGIWLDLPIFTLSNLDWIINIHQNQHIVNRAGRLPRILLFYHPIQSGFPYSCDKEGCQMKNQLSFATTFIAAEPKTNFISFWLQELMKNLQSFQGPLKFKLANLNITYETIDSGAELSKLTLKSIISVHNKQLQPKANIILQRFRIWVMSSFTGLDKLKQYTNFDVGFSSNNIYLWSHPISRVTSLLGDFHYLIHISHQEEQYLNRQLIDPKTIFIHPNSFLVEHILNFTLFDQIVNNDGGNALQIVPQGPIQFPKLVWAYLQNGGMEQDQRWLENNIFYCQGYKVQIVNQKNYLQFITDTTIIESLLQIVPKLLANEQTKQKVRQQLIIYAIIYNMGGIFISGDVFLTQSIAWIKNIKNNPHVIGRKDFALNFAFFKKYSTASKDKNSKVGNGYLREFFFASAKQSQLVLDILKTYETLLSSSVKNGNYFLSPSQVFHEVLDLLYVNVASKKPKNTQKTKQSLFNELLQYYRIATMDSNYFAQKLSHFPIPQKVNMLGKMSYEQVRQLVGPFNYMIRFDGIHELLLLSKYKKVEESSFLVSHLHFQQQQFKFMPKVLEAVGSKWEDLPKMMWYFEQDRQIISQTDQKIRAKVQKYCHDSAIALMTIDNLKIKGFIQAEALQFINKAVSERNTRIQDQIQVYLQRLALIIQHGGIFLSSHYIPTQNFSWIFDPPSNSFIYNRYQGSPSLIHFFGLNHYQYNVDGRYGVRVVNPYSMSFKFIAANKDNQFLLALFKEIIEILTKNDQVLNFKLSKIGIDQSKWQFLTPTITIAAAYNSLIDKKARELTSPNGGTNENMYEALRSWKIWAIAEQSGPTKLSQPYFQTAESLHDAVCLKNGQEMDEIFGAPEFFIMLNSGSKSAVQKGQCHELSYAKRSLLTK